MCKAVEESRVPPAFSCLGARREFKGVLYLWLLDVETVACGITPKPPKDSMGERHKVLKQLPRRCRCLPQYSAVLCIPPAITAEAQRCLPLAQTLSDCLSALSLCCPIVSK